MPKAAIELLRSSTNDLVRLLFTGISFIHSGLVYAYKELDYACSCCSNWGKRAREMKRNGGRVERWRDGDRVCDY